MIEFWENIIRRTGLTSDNLFINSSESSMRLEMETLEEKKVVWIYFQTIRITENLLYRYFTAKQICKL